MGREFVVDFRLQNFEQIQFFNGFMSSAQYWGYSWHNFFLTVYIGSGKIDSMVVRVETCIRFGSCLAMLK